MDPAERYPIPIVKILPIQGYPARGTRETFRMVRALTDLNELVQDRYRMLAPDAFHLEQLIPIVQAIWQPIVADFEHFVRQIHLTPVAVEATRMPSAIDGADFVANHWRLALFTFRSDKPCIILFAIEQTADFNEGPLHQVTMAMMATEMVGAETIVQHDYEWASDFIGA